MFRTRTLFMPFMFALAVGLSACTSEAPNDSPAEAAENPSDAAGEGEVGPEANPDDGGDNEGDVPAASGAVDADGFVIPGEVVNLELGDSVTYYSMPNLTLDEAQKVTIHSVEYIEKADLPAEAPHDEFDTGVIVVSLTWESVLGSVQSNQGYLQVEHDSGQGGYSLFYREDKLQNGGVPDGGSETGTYTYAIERGPTTLTLGDYTDVPVAQLKIDTSN